MFQCGKEQGGVVARLKCPPFVVFRRRIREKLIFRRSVQDHLSFFGWIKINSGRPDRRRQRWLAAAGHFLARLRQRGSTVGAGFRTMDVRTDSSRKGVTGVTAPVFAGSRCLSAPP